MHSWYKNKEEKESLKYLGTWIPDTTSYQMLLSKPEAWGGWRGSLLYQNFVRITKIIFKTRWWRQFDPTFKRWRSRPWLMCSYNPWIPLDWEFLYEPWWCISCVTLHHLPCWSWYVQSHSCSVWRGIPKKIEGWKETANGFQESWNAGPQRHFASFTDILIY